MRDSKFLIYFCGQFVGFLQGQCFLRGDYLNFWSLRVLALFFRVFKIESDPLVGLGFVKIVPRLFWLFLQNWYLSRFYL